MKNLFRNIIDYFVKPFYQHQFLYRKWCWIKTIFYFISSIWNKDVRKELKQDWEYEKVYELNSYTDYCVDYIFKHNPKKMYVCGKDEKEQKQDIRKMIIRDDNDDLSFIEN